MFLNQCQFQFLFPLLSEALIPIPTTEQSVVSVVNPVEDYQEYLMDLLVVGTQGKLAVQFTITIILTSISLEVTKRRNEPIGKKFHCMN